MSESMVQSLYPTEDRGALQLEIESLKSTVEFLTGMVERTTESGAGSHDQISQLAENQRMLIDKIQEIIECQQALHAWAANLAQPSVVPQPVPATLPPIMIKQ